MSYTLAQLRTLQTQLLGMDLDNYAGASPSSSDQNLQINWALRLMSRRLLLFDDNVTLTLVANQYRYNLRDTTTPAVSKRIVAPMTCYIGGTALQDRMTRGPGLWTWAEFSQLYPTWKTDSAATPTLAVFLGNNGGSNFILYPKPSSIGSNNSISGLVLAPDLANDSDVPAIPEECHEALAALAAVKAANPLATEQESWQRLQSYGDYAQIVDAHRAVNKAVLENLGSTSTLIAPLLTEPDAPTVPTEPNPQGQ